MLLLSKNFDFLNDLSSCKGFIFRTQIMDLVSRIEESLKDDVISNSILNDCRKIYEYIVLQLGSIKNIKYENFDTTDRVKQVSTQLWDMIRFTPNEVLSFDHLRKIGNLNSHVNLDTDSHNVENFEVLFSLKCIWWLIRLILRQLNESCEISQFSQDAYIKCRQQDNKIINKEIIKKIEDDSFRSNNSFDIYRVPICSLLNGLKVTYKVPIYQRGYAWNKTNIDTLIRDIEKRIIDSQEHYLGVVAVREQKTSLKDNKMIKIIDGQQRLTTSVLLLCAIRDVLKDIHGIDVNYTNITSDVINPGGSDISNSAFDDIVERKHLKLSNPSYRKENYYINYLIFYEHLKTKSKEEIESFGATYVKNFKIACISFNEDALSNKKEMEIFENLNTKGKNLDLFDITKNFIFNLCEEQTLNKYERDVVVEFNHLISNLPSEKEEKKQSWMNDFFTSLIHYITGDELSKTQGRIDSTNYLLKLEKTLDELFEKKLRNVNGVNFSIYKELINVIHRYLKIWTSIKFIERKLRYVEIMNICDIIGLITQDKKLTPIYPVIYLFFDMFEINDDGIDRDTIDKTLKKNIKFFIFEIIKQLIRIDLNKGQGDSTTAVKFWQITSESRVIWKKKSRDEAIKYILDKLREYAVNSGDLFSSLNAIDKNSWTHTAILQILEWYLLGKDTGGAIFDYKPTLEHILPKEFEKYWMTDLKLWNGGKAEDVIIKDAKNNINKIGNYCLLTQPWNSKNKNLSFARKKDLLKDNVSPLYRNHSNSNIDISSKKQWNFLEISKRSEEIIKIITTKIYSDK